MSKTKPQDYFAEIRNLSNGGTLAVERMPSMESFTLGFFLPVGAAQESRRESGISHFIEHMLFKGSKKRSAKAIVKSIERVGGIINASTGREVTYFYCRVAAKRLDLAFDVLTDLVFNPVFDNGPGGYGYDRVGEAYKEFSPLHNLREGMPPAVVFLGTEDDLIPVETARYFETVMEKVGSRCDLFLYEGEGHGFFNYGRYENYKDTREKADTFLISTGFLQQLPDPELRMGYPAPKPSIAVDEWQ